MKKIFSLCFLLISFSACSFNDSKKNHIINLKEEKEVYSKDVKVKPDSAEIVNDSVKLNFTWRFGNNEDSTKKMSFFNSGTTIAVYQDGELLLPDNDLREKWSTEIYETSDGSLALGFKLLNKFSPVSVKIFPSGMPYDYYPFNFIFNVSGNNPIPQKEAELSFVEDYLINSFNSLYESAKAMDNNQDFGYFLEELEYNNSLIKSKSVHIEDSKFIEYSEILSYCFEMQIKFLKEFQANDFAHYEDFKKAQTNSFETFTKMNHDFFYTKKTFEETNSRFSNIKKTKEIDFSSKSLEEKLNNEEDVIGKTVKFEIKETTNSKSYGYNLIAGDHLNFVSFNEAPFSAGEEIAVRVTEVKKVFGSYIIRYELLDN